MHDPIAYNRRYLRTYNLTRCVPGRCRDCKARVRKYVRCAGCRAVHRVKSREYRERKRVDGVYNAQKGV